MLTEVKKENNEMRDFLRVVRRALLLVISYIETRYPDAK